jgi:hypothetical protein
VVWGAFVRLCRSFVVWGRLCAFFARLCAVCWSAVDRGFFFAGWDFFLLLPPCAFLGGGFFWVVAWEISFGWWEGVKFLCGWVNFFISARFFEGPKKKNFFVGFLWVGRSGRAFQILKSPTKKRKFLDFSGGKISGSQFFEQKKPWNPRIFWIPFLGGVKIGISCHMLHTVLFRQQISGVGFTNIVTCCTRSFFVHDSFNLGCISITKKLRVQHVTIFVNPTLEICRWKSSVCSM